MKHGAGERNLAVRAIPAARSGVPLLNPIISGKSRRPKGFWKNMYIGKQQSHPEGAEAEQRQAEPARQHNRVGMKHHATELRVGDLKRPFIGRSLDTLHPPPTPGLFEQDWLRSLLCEGCSLPATTNAIKCRHCNLVVHFWCRDVRPRSKRGNRRRSAIVPKQQKNTARVNGKNVSRDAIEAWVCWECIEDMVLALQFYRGLKNRQMGAHLEKQAAEKIIRFISWVATSNRTIKEHLRAILIQSHVRMRLVFVRFKRWMQSQKRVIVVAVRSASGLPLGDPITRKCNPYIMISVVEPFSNETSGTQRQVQTLCHQLPTRKGREDAEVSLQLPRHAAAVGGEKGRKGGRKDKSERVQTFHWEEEFLLPGVSDSATIVFTVLHQTPTRVVCLGQALVYPKNFSKFGEHVKKVPLEKQSVAVRFNDHNRKEHRRIDDAEWEKPGNLTFVVRKASYCDSYCGELCGPIVEEIRSLALAESHGTRIGSTPSTSSGGEATAVTAAAAKAGDRQHNRHPHPPLKSVGTSKSSKRLLTAADSETRGVASGGGGGKGGGTVSVSIVPHKVGDLTTVWWACMWLGRLRLYRNLGDTNPKLNLQLDGWRAMEDEEGGKHTRPDLRLVNSTSTRWLFLRCPTRVELNRWKDVLERNHADEVRRRHGQSHSSKLHDSMNHNNASPHVHHHHHHNQHHHNHQKQGGPNSDVGSERSFDSAAKESISSSQTADHTRTGLASPRSPVT